MILSPGAKLNLGLYITGKRPDGYHNLLTCFFQIPFSDSLEIAKAAEQDSMEAPYEKWTHKLAPSNPLQPAAVQLPHLPIRFSCSGLEIKGAVEDNLCIKAYELLKKDFPQLPAIQMHLHKKVPMGAGLGGGSADASATLLYLNELGNLGLMESQLVDYAQRLGSDCPFFIKQGPQIGRGKGEILDPVKLSLKGYHLVLVCPGIHVPTPVAFKLVTPQPGPSMEQFMALLASGASNWKDTLMNQFEASVFAQFTKIAAIKKALYDKGAIYASMSGSGSAVFGLFNKDAFEAISIENALADELGDLDIHSWLL